MPAIYHHQLTVTEREIDRLGHVNNIEYLRWMQDAATAHSAAQGWPGQRYRDLGAGWVVRSHKIEYLSPAFLDNVIVVNTWVSSMDKIRSSRRFQIVRLRDQVVLAEAETEWVFISFQRQLPCRIPTEVREAFVVMSAADHPVPVPTE